MFILPIPIMSKRTIAEDVIATTDYHQTVTAVVTRGNI